MFSGLSRFSNFGQLILRVGLGIMMVAHGLPKLSGGMEKWEKIGGAMQHVGINFMPTVFGFTAAITETLGGVLFALGLAFRSASFFLLMTMIVAAAMHLSSGDGLMGSSHPIELAFVFLGMIFIGPGKYSIDKK